MQSNESKNFRVEEGLSYLDQIKERFGVESQVYKNFLEIMQEFKSQSIDSLDLIQRVVNLFRKHPDLIVGFANFVPSYHKLEVLPDGQVEVTIPIANLEGGTGYTTLTILSDDEPDASQNVTQSNLSSSTTSPHSSSGNIENRVD